MLLLKELYDIGGGMLQFQKSRGSGSKECINNIGESHKHKVQPPHPQ